MAPLLTAGCENQMQHCWLSQSNATTPLCRNAQLQDSLQSTPLNILQNTEYVHNDVDVDDVDDDKEGREANFFLVRDRDGEITSSLGTRSFPYAFSYFSAGWNMTNSTDSSAFLLARVSCTTL